jgi:hypothetical protein
VAAWSSCAIIPAISLNVDDDDVTCRLRQRKIAMSLLDCFLKVDPVKTVIQAEQ